MNGIIYKNVGTNEIIHKNVVVKMRLLRSCRLGIAAWKIGAHGQRPRVTCGREIEQLDIGIETHSFLTSQRFGKQQFLFFLLHKPAKYGLKQGDFYCLASH